MNCSIEFLEATPDRKKQYIDVLKVVKKYRPDVDAVDMNGHTCFHHAAMAGNALGLQFCVQMLNYF